MYTQLQLLVIKIKLATLVESDINFGADENESTPFPGHDS